MSDNISSQPKAPFESDPFAAAYPETREFWQAGAEGRFLLKICDDCRRAHWYPRSLCPLCGSDRTSWIEASGRGKLYAFSAPAKAQPPYILAYVTLDEGPTIMTNIVDADAGSLRIGQPLTVRMRAAAEGRMLPFFAPV
ncbi:MAG: OB-fold domain-containing protein [Burkholderiaceae bacterium]